MSESNFYILFGITWVAAMAYGLSAFRLLARIRGLKAEGKAGEAPDPLINPLELFGYLGWLLGGRYAELNDDVATRWAGIARVLFIVAAPLILAVFAIALTHAGAWSQPT
jgi:hypothetical protein